MDLRNNLYFREETLVFKNTIEKYNYEILLRNCFNSILSRLCYKQSLIVTLTFLIIYSISFLLQVS